MKRNKMTLDEYEAKLKVLFFDGMCSTEIVWLDFMELHQRVMFSFVQSIQKSQAAGEDDDSPV